MSLFPDRELGLIKALGDVFPESKHILCMVHVMRNIEDKALNLSNMKTIQVSFSKGCMKLFSSTTVDQYEKQLKYMSSKWKNNWGLMRYLTENWLDPYKDRLFSHYHMICIK
ncbi:unnamed protein product [Cuscuta europaea]|uniref:MULE transposase domain-containing protein n=1 Tax=Cuscuta europaea TaxID=41803 RepID=A0A9P0YPD2_CUSEU|nr:unnamed protein product [Cuscuta europaea]